MRKKFVLTIGLFLVFLLTLPVFSVDIKGLVTDQKTGEPLSGANVFIQDTNIGTTTDRDGYFSLYYDAEGNFNLIFNYVGYKALTLTLNSQDKLSALAIKMKEDIFRSEEIVTTGIASRTSKDIAEVSVSRVAAESYTDATSYQDLSQLVAGKVSGIQIKPSSGNVGGGFSFYVRSGGGLNGNEQPLIFIDGVRIDNSEVVGYGTGGQGMSALADLNPDDIENIEILKGPAGAATYGANGSNGVVLITTKRGRIVPSKDGKGNGIAINYRYLSGWNEQSYEYGKNEFLSYKDANNIFRTGPITQNTISATGGTSYLKYFASFDKRNEDGILVGNYLNRNSVRMNINAFPNEKISLRLSGSYSITEMSRPWNDNNIYGYLGNTLLWPNSYGYTDSASIVALQDRNDINRFIGSANITYTPIKNLDANFAIGVDNSNWRQDQLFPADKPYLLLSNGRRSIYNRQNRQFTYDFNVRYKYNVMPDLMASSMFGTQIFERKNTTSNLTAEGFDTELITDINAGAEFKDKDESKFHGKDAGIFFEQTFSYINQYYLTLGVRKDYASTIGDKAPSIIYPKASFALRLDKYDFIPSFFNLFKTRVAYGESGVLPGSRDGIPFLWRAQPSGYGAGAVLSAIGNGKIEPERIKEIELGFETEFFTNYSAEFTYYRQYAVNSIVGQNESPSTGLTASSIPFNIGGMESSGWESRLQAVPIRSRDYELNMSFIWNYQENKVTDMGGAQPIYSWDVNVIKEDLPKHEFYTWKVEGAEFDANGNYTGPKISDDRVSFGNPIPNHTGSFSLNFRFLKNFKFYALLDWALGHKVFNYTKQFPTRLGNNPEFNKLANQLDVAGNTSVGWFAEVDTNITRLAPGSAEYKAAAEKYAKMDWRYDGNYIQDADYLKIREISLSYSFKDILAKYPSYQLVDDVILGISARNLVTFTKYDGADVEVNVGGSRSGARGIDFLTLQNPTVYNFWLRLAL